MPEIRSQIVKDILKTVKENKKCGNEEIINAVEADTNIIEEYISTLSNEDFLKEHHSKTKYELTDKGESIMSAFNKLDEATSISIIF